MPEFYMRFARKINKIPEFYMICARKKNNKMPEFYTIFARKKIVFARIWRNCPPAPRLLYAYGYIGSSLLNKSAVQCCLSHATI